MSGTCSPASDTGSGLRGSRVCRAAGNMKSSVDAKTGMLELRETANSTLKGQVVLACNLNTIGTHHSIEAKRPSNR